MTNVVKEFIRIPAEIQRRAGIAAGDLVDIKATRGRITIVTRAHPLPKDEYTSVQRKAIDAQLAKAAQGPFHGPFSSGAEVSACLVRFKRAHAKPDQRPPTRRP